MNRIHNLHNKTQEVKAEELPYNSNNFLMSPQDLRSLFDNNGLQGIEFHNINLYRNALVHRSYCTMKNDDFETGNERCPKDCLPLQEMSYERLEFLGDAILGMVVARYLYERYPDQNEGFLSRLRTKIVNGKMLGHLAELVGFPKFAIISKQIEDVSGRTNYKIMEDIFEAFIGAIYMDFQQPDDEVSMPSAIRLPDGPLTGAGYYIAEQWITHIMEKNLDFTELIQSRTNYKDMLVRFMQHSFQDAPRFCEISVNVRNNQKVFEYCVKNKSGAILGRATGASKKDAENIAAKNALSYYGQNVA
ncbi:putative ribonuclease 3 [Dishui Lake large algae virus 1]|nr:putative ribonuclease 3 [Dishui Lake large algae virus 1]